VGGQNDQDNQVEDRHRAVAILFIVLVAVGFKIYRDKFYVNLPDYPPINRAAWLDQNWSQQQRECSTTPTRARKLSTFRMNGLSHWSSRRLPLWGTWPPERPVLSRPLGFIPGATKGGENSCRSVLRAAVR